PEGHRTLPTFGRVDGRGGSPPALLLRARDRPSDRVRHRLRSQPLPNPPPRGVAGRVLVRLVQRGDPARRPPSRSRGRLVAAVAPAARAMQLPVAEELRAP